MTDAPDNTKQETERTALTIEAITDSLCGFLQEKNRRYGNAVFDTNTVFSDPDPLPGIKRRIDDKLKRIRTSRPELRKNDVVDLMGYLILICVYHKWTNFDDLLD